MDEPFSVEDWSDRMYHNLAKIRRENNRRIHVCVTAAVIFNTVVSACVVMYVFSTQAKASPIHKLPEQMRRVAVQTKVNGSSSLMPPYAHLTVHNASGAGGIISWKLDPHSNMKYNSTNRSLLIPKSGLYNIYLQVIYCSKDLDTDTTCANYEQRYLKHEVNKKNKNYNSTPVSIITAIETVSCKEVRWFRTVHSTARLHLNGGDELQVKSEEPAYNFVNMHGKPHRETFWGVYQHTDMN